MGNCQCFEGLAPAKPKSDGKRKLLTAQIMPATTFDRQQVPPGFDKPPVVAVVLPGVEYAQLIAKQTDRSFEYHLLRNFDYNMFSPFDFDADAFVEEAIEYCRTHNVQAVTGLNCFATLLCSIIREELGLPGSSFKSVLNCCNKYYMRKNLTPDCQPYEAGKPPPKYPAVVKLADCQFYSAVRIVHSDAEWEAAWKSLKGMLDLGKEARQRFYIKWSKRFGFELEKRWEDVVLLFTEPYIPNKAEFQAEVVITAGGEMLTADTGDICHMEGGDNITMFKTPANIEMTPVSLAWLKGIVAKLVEYGYRSLAMDVEIMRVDCAEEKYELVEINSRYSYMGDWHIVVPADLTDSRRAFVCSALTSMLHGTAQADSLAAFREMDANADKTVTREELKRFMQRIGLYRKSDDVDVLFEAMDVNGDGMIQLSEFQAALNKAVADIDKLPKEVKATPKEVRNLLNRTRLALGHDPMTLPDRDQVGVSKIAAAVFTDRLGKISDIFDQKALDAYLAEGTIDTWCPEPPVSSGEVKESDLIFGGWARLGYLIMTWKDDLPEINRRLNTVIKDLFIHQDRGWLPVHLYSEKAVDPQLKPTHDMLLKR
eukprot:gb/GFBE01058559.1/.p1 GENE.gb/GFBE01058559.1/~~gb/GFBE01058559.1/.p1  ORF type:complete len:597 (+),score=162.97 gb/GFBE01058559.1/:1-1791(+)